MAPHPDTALLARLERLERSLAQTRRAAMALAAGLLITWTLSLAPGAPLQAAAQPLLAAGPGLDPATLQDPEDSRVADAPRPQEIVLRDAQGRRRVWIGALAGGGAGLGLFDDNGFPRAELMLDTQGETRLLLSDRAGVARAHVGLAADGRPMVQLADAAGQTAVGLGLFPDGSRRLVFHGAARERALDLRVLSDGRPALEVSGRDGQSRISLGLTSLEDPLLRLRDGSGRSLYSRP